MYKYDHICDKVINNPISFRYKNWKGETSIRNVIPIEMWYGNSDFHKGNQWFMKAFDTTKQDSRDFAMLDIIEYIKTEER